MPFNSETGLYEIYEPPIEEAMSRCLLDHYQMNGKPTDRYERSIEEIWHLDDVAQRDGRRRDTARPLYGIYVSYLIAVRGGTIRYSIPSQPIAAEDVDLYQSIVVQFEQAVNPDSYFMYRYCRYLVWKCSNVSSLARNPMDELSSNLRTIRSAKPWLWSRLSRPDGRRTRSS